MRLASLIALALVIWASMATADTTTQKKLFQFQQKADPTIFGASVTAQDASRLIPENTAAFGVASATLLSPYSTDTPVRMNHLGELLVATAILQLADLSFLPAVDGTSAIPSQYLPRGIQLVNPAFPAATITLRHLLTHTSSITDAKFATFAKTAPDAVLDARSFAEAYFLTSTGGTFAIASDIFSTAQPGAASSYSYAKANIALLTFIIEQVVIASPSLVTGSQKTALAYITEKILIPLGMSNTFVRLVDGTLPTLSFPNAASIYSGAIVQDLSSSGTEVTRPPLHPAVFAQMMTYSTASDVGKLVRALFLDATSTGKFKALGTRMKASYITVSGLSTAASGQTGQGLGIWSFDGSVVCAKALASATITKCPFSSTSSVWGMIATGEYSQAAFMCSDALNSQNPTCAATMVSYFNSGAALKSSDLTLAMMGVTFQGAVGDSTSVSQSPIEVSSASALYGLWVFFGVLGVLLFTIVSAYATEYIIQPAPPMTGVVPPTAVPTAGASRDMYFGDN